jgi:hypothetical protein
MHIIDGNRLVLWFFLYICVVLLTSTRILSLPWFPFRTAMTIHGYAPYISFESITVYGMCSAACCDDARQQLSCSLSDCVRECAGQPHPLPRRLLPAPQLEPTHMQMYGVIHSLPAKNRHGMGNRRATSRDMVSILAVTMKRVYIADVT